MCFEVKKFLKNENITGIELELLQSEPLLQDFFYL